jgi:hypothetical protein
MQIYLIRFIELKFFLEVHPHLHWILFLLTKFKVKENKKFKEIKRIDKLKALIYHSDKVDDQALKVKY